MHKQRNELMEVKILEELGLRVHLTHERHAKVLMQGEEFRADDTNQSLQINLIWSSILKCCLNLTTHVTNCCKYFVIRDSRAHSHISTPGVSQTTEKRVVKGEGRTFQPSACLFCGRATTTRRHAETTTRCPTDTITQLL